MKIEELTAGCPDPYIVRGHVDPQEMEDETRRQLDAPNLSLETSKHTEMRARPRSQGVWYDETTQGRGAFATTIAGQP